MLILQCLVQGRQLRKLRRIRHFRQLLTRPTSTDLTGTVIRPGTTPSTPRPTTTSITSSITSFTPSERRKPDNDDIEDRTSSKNLSRTGKFKNRTRNEDDYDDDDDDANVTPMKRILKRTEHKLVT